MLSGRVQTYSTEKRYIKKDRSRVWICLTVSFVRNSSGEPEYFISIIEDITQRKLKEFVPDPLTPREFEALRLMAQGKTNREIGQGLNYSTGTAKLDIRRFAVEIGLIPPQ